MSEKQRTLFTIDQPQQIKLSGHTIRVAFDAGVDQTFDYAVGENAWPIGLGQRVVVPFGRGDKPKTGFCIGCDISGFNAEQNYKIKVVSEVVDKKPLLTPQLLELAQWISDYYVCPLGQVLSAILPAAVKKGIGIVKKCFLYIDTAQEQTLQEHKTKLSRAQKQLQALTYLEERQAFTAANAIEQSEVSQQTGISTAIIKKLVESGIVRYYKKEAVHSLPVVPEDFSVKSGYKITLNAEQAAAVAHITDSINGGKFSVSLLHGVTDSGKTEVYIRAVEYALSKGKKAIIILPEIALTAQTVRRFSARFEKLAVLHSSLTDAQRNGQWQKIAAGDADVIIGARSAVFAPVDNLGVIVVDEEHESTYKQDVVPRYNGRDVAIKRAQIENAHCILGSATPSLETLHNCQTKKHFTLLRLTKRVMDLPMPQMKCIDLSKIPGEPFANLISEEMQTELCEVLKRKEQAILLLNRRGYSSLVYCPNCKYILHCRNCDISLTYHRSSFEDSSADNGVMSRYKSDGYATCHYCGSRSLVPTQCPICRHKFAMMGIGVQKLEEELGRKFPNAVIKRIDSDSMQSADYYQLLKDFADGKIDILAGTQILAKGLHFPNVTLVGVVNADAAIAVTDFRANEKAFQLISQVAGRTGRGSKPGVVMIQTIKPDQPALRLAMRNDFDGFVKTELFMREKCKLPPYSRMAVVLMRCENFQRLEEAAKTIAQSAADIIKAGSFDITLRGPMACPIPRVNRMHRMQLVLLAPNPVILAGFFKIFRGLANKTPVKMLFDIDPMM